ncbi:MAG TPA: hypothetical protein VNT55_02535 [Baekduia sp.]|nr:hypothetical protein [Baekduia sp.]
MTVAVTEATRAAQAILRDGSQFQWSALALLGLVTYVYSVEIERRRWDVILAGLAFWLMDWFNEIANSVILHASGRSALWTVTGHTSYLILVGLTLEITLLFLVTGVAFVKQLPADGTRRWTWIFASAVLSVAVELFLHSTGFFVWEYWWWNWPCVPLIVVFGYMTFYAVAAWVYDMGTDHRRQLRVVGTLAAVDATGLVVFGAVGWL